MFKKVKVKHKLLLIVIGTIITISTIIAIKSIYSINMLTNKNIENYKKNAYKQKELELESYVTLAIKTVDSYYQRTSKDKVQTEVEDDLKEKSDFLFSIINKQYELSKDRLTKKELETKIIQIVNATRFGKSGYFWINDLNAKIIEHPIKPSLNGKDLSNFEDKNGKKIFVEFAKKVKQSNHGFVDYVWPKPGFDKPQQKISYVKLFKPFNWVIGTGEYVDNVTQHMKEQAKKNIEKMKYSNSGYFWINDINHKMVMHAVKPALNGKDVSGIKDPTGVYLFQEFVKTVKEKKAGLVKYMWSKPGEKEPQQKFSYVKLFEPWGWVIGTGAYVDDIEKQVSIMYTRAQEEINTIILQIAIISLISAIIISFIVGLISHNAIINPIENFQNGLLEFFKYLNKESNDVKELEITSNDEIGEMAKVVNANIKKTKQLIEQDKVVLNEVSYLVKEVSSGTLSRRILHTSDNPAMKELIGELNTMMSNLQETIGHSLDILTQYQANDFRVKTSADCTGELCALMKGIDDLGSTISQMLVENKSNGMTLNESAKHLLINVDTINTSAQDAAASLEETAASLEQVTGNIRANVENIGNMTTYAHHLTNSANEGHALANQTTQSMDAINAQVTSINEAISVIDQIAFQTNILSLNAAVEAATAGEAGKGFAVVAAEVRNLASRSADAAREIKELVENATIKANEGKNIADKMIEGYDGLNKNINETITLMDDISDASKEQQSGIEQINDAVSQLDRQTQINVNVAIQTQIISTQTSKISQKIVDSANDKEFEGKDDVQAINVNEVEANQKPSHVEKISKPIKKSYKKASKIPKQKIEITSQAGNKADEWESF